MFQVEIQTRLLANASPQFFLRSTITVLGYQTSAFG